MSACIAYPRFRWITCEAVAIWVHVLQSLFGHFTQVGHCRQFYQCVFLFPVFMFCGRLCWCIGRFNCGALLSMCRLCHQIRCFLFAVCSVLRVPRGRGRPSRRASLTRQSTFPDCGRRLGRDDNNATRVCGFIGTTGFDRHVTATHVVGFASTVV